MCGHAALLRQCGTHMPKTSAESLEAFLHRQAASTLAAVLLEMAEVDEMVNARLLRLQLADRPDKLAAGFRKTLMSWQRSTNYYTYRDAPAYGQMLKAWLDQVGRELVPKDPAAGLALFETFIEADEVWFGHADDSGADIGEAVRSACRHWLQAAALCETPADIWPERLMRLYLAHDYGAREELLRSANLLLPEPALRTLIARFKSRMADVLSGASKPGDLPHEVYAISAALSLLSEAVGDPDVMVRAVLSYSPQPNGLQRASYVEAYLRADRPDDALTWLREPWADREDDRRSLLARVLERLGRFKESVPIRRQAFESSPSVLPAMLVCASAGQRPRRSGGRGSPTRTEFQGSGNRSESIGRTRGHRSGRSKAGGGSGPSQRRVLRLAGAADESVSDARVLAR